MSQISNEIDRLSYWEHFKKAKDLALIYPPEHPKRKEIETEIQKLLERINNQQTKPLKI